MEFKKFHDSSSDRKSSFESKTNSREHKIAEAKSANEFDTSRTALERIGFDGRPNLSREDGGHGVPRVFSLINLGSRPSNDQHRNLL